jgi:hypothetical protein
MSAQRQILKQACIAELDQRARPHPAGHSAYSGRYIIDTSKGAVAVMFERSDRVPAHLWLPARAVGLTLPAVPTEAYPASACWQKKNAKGEALYGRHSNLLQMPELAKADLTRVTLESPQQLRQILNALGA